MGDLRANKDEPILTNFGKMKGSMQSMQSPRISEEIDDEGYSEDGFMSQRRGS